jgi:hypothetical protein
LSRSSIFSFDTLRASPAPTNAAWVAIAVCLAVRLLMAWRPDVLELVPSDCVDRHVLSAEDHLKQTSPAPKILLVGSSITHADLIPDQLAADFNLPAHEVGQIILPLGTPWDALLLFRRNPTLLDTPTLVVLDVGPWQMNDNIWTRIEGRWVWGATLEERLQAPPREEILALGDWVWPVISQRRELRKWVLGLPNLTRARSEAIASFSEDIDWTAHYWRTHADPVLRAKAMNRKGNSPEDAARDVEELHWSARMEGSLRQLLKLLHNHEIRVLLHQPPMHPDYCSYIEQHPRARDNLSTFACFAQTLAGSDVRVKIWDRAEEVGIREEDFIDYGHYGHAGAASYTRAVHGLIERERLFAKAAETRQAGQLHLKHEAAQPQ